MSNVFKQESSYPISRQVSRYEARMRAKLHKIGGLKPFQADEKPHRSFKDEMKMIKRLMPRKKFEKGEGPVPEVITYKTGN